MTYVAVGTATAAEIAAAATAAEIAAAVTAAEVAAATAAAAETAAAATAAAETAAAATTATEAITAAPEAAGILEAAPGVVPPPATSPPPAGIEQIGQAGAAPPPAGAAPPAGLEQVAGSTPPPPAEPASIQTASGPATSDMGSFSQDQQLIDMVKNARPDQMVPNNPLPSGFETPPINPNPAPVNPEVLSAAQTTPESINAAAKAMESVPTNTNPFLEGYNSVKSFVKANPFESAVLGYTGLTMLGGSNQSSGQAISEEQNRANRKSQSTISPNFRPGPYSQPNVYQEKRYNYALGGVAGMQNSYDDENGSDMASGGIVSFAKGTPRERDPEADFARYYAMMEGQKPEQPPAPSYVGKVGIAYDDDQDTRYQDPLTAALIRLDKRTKLAGIPKGPVISRPKPLGTINLAPPGTQQAASGGIMGYNLGGYADGGNPRLLKGPGDGMSDNIPAVIGSSQPARLADGEFVVPADVVSHLGNGSTAAGAKKLHQMMDKIRMARTGKKKQAPAVKPKKYMPA